MLGTVLALTGFVVAILAILGFTPRMEQWATAPVAYDPAPERPDEIDAVETLAVR